MTRALRSAPTICTLSSAPIVGGFRRNQRHRQALTHRVAVAAGSHEADHCARSPDRLVTGRVGIDRVDFERDQLALRRRSFAIGQRRLAAEEIGFVPGDPAIHAGHPGVYDLA